jgi:hypothetical protein
VSINHPAGSRPPFFISAAANPSTEKVARSFRTFWLQEREGRSSELLLSVQIFVAGNIEAMLASRRIISGVRRQYSHYQGYIMM